jgi:7,8-dihydropterin-6-yl-methyl-4-(beta-D-ribofuranosyl)aminobenzene 5'-phosphate synthase
MKIVLIAEASTKLQHALRFWGLSFLIGENVLFDTFSNGRVLLKNMKRLHVDPLKIEHAVLSHEHWDHTGGLEELLKTNPNIKVYICEGFSQRCENDLKDRFPVEVIRIRDPLQIALSVHSSGQIEGRYNDNTIFEQCLVVDRGEFVDVLVGCCHPGVVKMVQTVLERFEKPIGLLAGGFHLPNKETSQISRIVDEIERLNVKRIMPCHCTGREAVKIFRDRFQDRFIAPRVGIEL